MKKLISSLFVAAFAAVSFGENLYRTQINDGEWQYWETLADAVNNSISKSDTSIKTVVIELLKDDSTTWTTEILLGRNGSTLGYSDRTCRIRSSTEGGSTTRYTLKRAAAAACFRASMPSFDRISVSFENIVIDGGAVWTDPDDPSSMANTGVGAGQLFSNNGTYRATWTFGDGVTVRNVETSGNSNSGGVLNFPGANSPITLNLLAGSRIENCRGAAVIMMYRQLMSLNIDGCVITKCGVTVDSVGLLYLYNHVQSASYAYGAKTLRNATITDNYIKSSAAVRFSGEFELDVSGLTTIADNVNAKGEAADLSLGATSTLKVDQALDGGSRIGIVSAAVPEIGAKFGEVGEGLAVDGEAFFWDGNSGETWCFGRQDGTDLVWTEGAARKISYEAFDWDGYADGKTHSAVVKVIAPETAVTYYALDPSGPWSTELPDTTQPGAYTVHYRIEAPNCGTVTGSRQVVAYDESYVPEMKCRTRVDGGEWTYQPDFVTACSVVSQQNYVGTAWTVDIELMCNQTMDGTVQLGFYKSGTSKHTSGRTVNIRTRSDNGQRYTLTRTTDSAKFYLTVHGEKTAYNFSNIVLDGGAEWTNEDDVSDLANGGVALSGNFFSCVGNSYSQWVVLGEGAVLRNFDLSGGCLMAMTSVAYDKFRMESGSLVTDCRGGTFVDWQRHTGHLELVGGLLTRCSTGTKPNLFALSTSKATLPPSYPHGSHLVGGDFTMTSNAVGSAGYAFSCDMYCLFGVGERAVVRDNLRADGTAANVYAGGTSNLCLSAAFEKGADVGVRIAGVKPGKGVEFGLATGFEDGDDVTTRHPNAAYGLFADEKPRYRGAVKDEKLVWTPRQNGLLLMVQ